MGNCMLGFVGWVVKVIWEEEKEEAKTKKIIYSEVLVWVDTEV